MHRLRPERRGGVLQHLHPCSRRTVLKGRKKDGIGAVGTEEVDTSMRERARGTLTLFESYGSIGTGV